MPTYAMQRLHLPAQSGFIAAMSAAALQTLAVPFVGLWADRIGQRRIMMGAAALFFLTAWPAFVLLSAHPALGVLIATVCWISILKSCYSGALPSLMASVFPVKVRVTGLSLSYNISVPLFGGFAPFYAASLIQLTGSPIAPAFYIMFTAVLSLLALLWLGRLPPVPAG